MPLKVVYTHTHETKPIITIVIYKVPLENGKKKNTFLLITYKRVRVYVIVEKSAKLSILYIFLSLPPYRCVRKYIYISISYRESQYESAVKLQLLDVIYTSLSIAC